MGLLQAAYKTYEMQAHKAGVIEEGKEPLTPISHIVQNAQIEITISDEGDFMSACRVPKEDRKTIIPATTESANRTSGIAKAHPLCEQLQYLAPYGKDKFFAYLDQLSLWAESEFSHPKVRAILAYVKKETILLDLAMTGVIAINENGEPENGKIEGSEYDKCMVRFRVIPAPEGTSAACFQDATLFQSFVDFYETQWGKGDQGICMLTGKRDQICEMHVKGIIPSKLQAKLISANDSSGFTYRGRFTTGREACSVSYIASQKAHNALRWVVSNHGVNLGGRTFLCWNPEGSPLPELTEFGATDSQTHDFADYQKQLLQTLGGYRKALKPEADVVIAALDAATTGRLSVTYYQEIKGSDFLNRIEKFYLSCCWQSRDYGIYTPSLRRIADCAFGTEQRQYIEADDRIRKEQIQRLLHCVIESQPIPTDIVYALIERTRMPLAYSAKNRETLLVTACAVVRKYENDRKKREEWTLALDTTNLDRSYLFGRLLAVAEEVERSTYDRQEGREPNAIRMQAVFSKRPLYAFRIIEEQLNPYFARMNPGLRRYFKNLMSEILDKLPAEDPKLNQKLDHTYLLGYYHQRTALTTKKETLKMEEKEDEYTEE